MWLSLSQILLKVMLHRGTIFNDNFNAILLHKKSIRVHGLGRRFVTQYLLPQRYVAQLWTDFKFLQRCCNKLIAMLITRIGFSRNNVALKVVQCNIIFIYRGLNQTISPIWILHTEFYLHKENLSYTTLWFLCSISVAVFLDPFPWYYAIAHCYYI